MSKKSRTGRRLTLAKGLRFDCQRCGDCCREFPIALSAAERDRYEARDWTDLLGFPGPVIEHASGRPYLARQANGECLFLREDGLCKMHDRYGEAEKPLVCRTFPFTLAEGGARPVVGGHFACSSLADGAGAPIANIRDSLWDRRTELVTARGVEPEPRLDERWLFKPGREYPREEVDFLLDLVGKEMEADRPFTQRILAISRFLQLVSDSDFPSLLTPRTKKAVLGFAEGIHDQVGRGLLAAPEGSASFPQRLLFRLQLAFAARRDPAWLLTAGMLRRTVRRFGNLLAGMGFLVGSGVVQPVGRERRVILGDVRRQGPPADPTSPAADGALTRYFVGQLSGRFLFREGFAVRGVLPALGLLIRQYPMILLFARAACVARGGDRVEKQDYASALRTVDWGFGRIPWDQGFLGGLRNRLLLDVDESLRLVVWCAGAWEAPDNNDPSGESNFG